MEKARHSPDPRRIRILNAKPDRDGPVIYWMSRDQRVSHNWALICSCLKANALCRPVAVIFTLSASFLGAPRRHYDFMLRGLAGVEAALRSKGIPLTILHGDPGSAVSEYAAEIDAGAVFTDFSPLNLTRAWKDKAAGLLPCSLCEVDAHNIVPCWLGSPKQEYAARTIRPKLNALLNSFLTEFPAPNPRYQAPVIDRPAIDPERLAAGVEADGSVMPFDWLEPGETAAGMQLQQFIDHGLDCYAKSRNDPNSGCVSRLSPYLHYGQISAQHVAISILRSGAHPQNVEAFIEELFIRRELAENYCFHNPRYDAFEGLPEWSKASLLEHAGDTREYVYALETFERAGTHDPLWNAAQARLVRTGLMHGYMRMYWAKKILEWSSSPVAAFEIAVALNDRYALDGRDPNGYAGIAWSIGGLHDRPWFERPVYGRIRYMNAAGCARKFDVQRYIGSVVGAPSSSP
jgi:deoxyribodipyrimidine photo-lyase